MEKSFFIKTPDKKRIYARLVGNMKKPAVVVVHGLFGSMRSALVYNSANYLNKKGFSVLLVELYGWKEGSRRLKDCTLKVHGQDIDTVIRYLRKCGAKKIFITGHSYGAPSIMHSVNKDFAAVVFWDVSYHRVTNNSFRGYKKIKGLNIRINDEGSLIGEEMYQEAKHVDSLKLVKELRVPIKFITAGTGPLLQAEKQMYQAANYPKEHIVIKGATHSFEEEGKQDQVYSET